MDYTLSEYNFVIVTVLVLVIIIVKNNNNKEEREAATATCRCQSIDREFNCEQTICVVDVFLEL